MVESKLGPDGDAMVDSEDQVVSGESPSADEVSAGSDEALRAEVERLRAENARLSSAAAPSHFWRNFGAGVLLTIGSILFAMALSAVWLNRTVMDENRWVDTVAPLAQDAAIQDWVATTASNAIIDAVDIQAYVSKALSSLPAQAQILATPITGAVENFVREAASKFVHSPQFPQLWVQMNRLAHKAFIASITQTQGKVVNNQNGQIILDVGVLADTIKQALSARGLGFVNNISIPAARQQIVLFQSAGLAQLGAAIELLNSLAYVLPILTLVLLAGGVALAADRRKAVLWLGVGIVVVTVLPLEAIYLAKVPFANAAYSLAQMPGEAAQNAYTIVFRNLVTAERVGAFLGLVFVMGAILAGPARWAVAVRGGLQHGISNIGPEWDFGPFGEWIYAHASGVRTAGIIVAIALLLLMPTKSIAAIIWLIVGVIVWILLVALFGRPRPQHTPDTDVDSGDDPGQPQAV